MATHAFRAMGTVVNVDGPEDGPFDRIVAAVRDRFAREEARFSRFRPESELSRVNRRAGRPTLVSPPFARALHAALRSAALTGGAFDPTVHDALLDAGYDRDFDEVLAGARGALHPPRPCGRWREIWLSDETLHLPTGVHLDLGGFAKGWTADVAAEEAVAAGAPWVLVDAGGDLRVAGDAPPLDVAVAWPWSDVAEAVRLRLRTGALATSSTCRRAWGDWLHHVIDPGTGAPVRGTLVQATVWAPSCAEAEVAATATLVTGTTPPGVPVVTVESTGIVRVSTQVEEAA